MTQEPRQTEDLTACTGYFAPTIKSWDSGSGLETKEEYDMLFEEEVDKQLNDEFRKNQNSWKSFLETKVPIDDRVWIDIEPNTHEGFVDKSWDFQISGKMVRLVQYQLSHSQEKDGAIAFKHVWPRCTSDTRVKIPLFVVPWRRRIWFYHFSIGGREKNPNNPEYIPFIRALSGHSEARIETTIRNIRSDQTREHFSLATVCRLG